VVPRSGEICIKVTPGLRVCQLEASDHWGYT
jgi:hypothetical protein